jgi:hypothetical protein
MINGSRFKCRLYTDHAPLTSLTNPARTMNSVRLASWAQNLQNVHTVSGDFSIEYANGDSNAIHNGPDCLSRLLDRGLHPDPEKWITCDSFRSFPPIKAIFDHVDREVDDRGRVMAY